MKKLKKVVRYYNEIKDSNGYIYSIDNLRIEFNLDKRFEKELFNYMGSIIRTDIFHRENFNHHKYKHLWTIKYDEYSSMTIGYCFNGNDIHSDMYKGFIDVNPNKTGMHEQFWNDFFTIKSFCKFFNVARCDIAMDIPIKREYLCLEKNNRKYRKLYSFKGAKYEKECHSKKDATEYLGKRSHIGFLKIYNKTAESELDYDLSRIEVTCLLSEESFRQYYPKIYDITQNTRLSNELDELTDTERALVEMAQILLVNGFDDGLMLFNSIGRVMKNKLRKFITPEQSIITYSEDALNQLIEKAQEIYL